MREVKREEFSLGKLTIKEKKSGIEVDVKGIVMYTEGGETYTDKINETSTKLPHVNLAIPFFKNLKGFVADVLWDTRMELFVTDEPNQNELRSALEPALKRWKKKLDGCIRIGGVELVGHDETAGVIITGTRALHKGEWVQFKTPALRFSSHLYGWEADLQGEIEAIIESVFNYKFRNEHGHPELTDGMGNSLENIPSGNKGVFENGETED